MAQADTASLNLYLPGHLARALKQYARDQRLPVGRVVDGWLSTLPEYAAWLARQDRLNLPQVSSSQQRLLIRVGAQSREALNTQTRALRVSLDETSLTGRRVLRGLIEERLQALGKL